MRFIYEEPVRGVVPGADFHALPGIERVRALAKGLVAPPPIHHLFGGRVTSFSVGSAVMTLPVSPWVVHLNTLMSLPGLAEASMTMAALTRLPEGVTPRLIGLDVQQRKHVTPADGHLVARATVLSSIEWSTWTSVDIEDADGRAVGTALGHFLPAPIDGSDLEPPRLLEPVALPRYPTDDPYRRPLPVELARVRRAFFDDPDFNLATHMTSDGSWGMALMLGEHSFGFDGAKGHGALTTNEWLCSLGPHVSPGLLSTFVLEVVVPLAITHGGGVGAVGPTSFAFVEPVPADGRDVRCEAEVLTPSATPGIIRARLTNDCGTLLATADVVTMAVPVTTARPAIEDARRVLVTVLFTDIVDSTTQAARLGDGRWSELLRRHDAIVAECLEAHGGQSVKHTGDGVLATFDSPTRAVACARRIATAVTETGVAVRAGLHTGEVELTGHDVLGTAVNTASRVESAAGPGEVWVSETTRALCGESGLSFADQGEHELKGLVEPMRLYRVEPGP